MIFIFVQKSMEFNFEDKKFKIIVISAVSTVVLWVWWYFAYQKFFNKPVAPQQVEDTKTDTTTDQTETKEEEKKDVKYVWEFNEEMKEIIDSLSTNYVQSFDAVIKWVEWYDVIQEKTLIESKTARKFWLNSLSKVQIEYLYNQNDVESMTQDNKQTEEVKETEWEWEEAEEWSETTKKEDKKVEIKVDQTWKKEWSYNWIKWDFDWKINWLFKFTNKHADQSKNEETSIKLIANFAWNEEKEDTSIERFSLTTKNWEIEELSRLDDYIFAKKNLTLANENQLMKKLSWYKVATSLRSFIEWLKEANIFNISKEPITQETKDTETKDTETKETTEEIKDTETKTDETKNTEETKNKDENKTTDETKTTDEISKVEESKEVEATKIESSWTWSNEVEMKEDAKPVEEWNVEENVEVKKDETKKEETTWDTEEVKEETTWEISQVDTNTEEVKYYVSLNNEEFKAFFDWKYKEIDSVLKLFWVETTWLQDSDYENAKLDWEIVKKWKDVVFTINSFTLWKNTITWTISNTEMNLTINWNQYKIMTGNNTLTVDITKKETNEHTLIKFTNPKDKAWLFIQMKTTAWKWLKKYVTTTKIQSLQTKWNEKLPALFKDSDKPTAQIKLNQIITDYSKILHNVSDKYIQESKNSNKQQNTNNTQKTNNTQSNIQNTNKPTSNTQTNTDKKQDTKTTDTNKNTKDAKNTKPTK